MDSINYSDCIAIWSNIISFFSIIINVILTVYIVRTIQRKLNNRRCLKDYLIDEIKQIRGDYRSFFNELNSDSIAPINIIPWLKMMNIKTSELDNILKRQYSINTELLSYQIDLMNLITENEDFINNYRKKNIHLSSKSINDFLIFRQKKSHVFNDVIIKINNA